VYLTGVTVSSPFPLSNAFQPNPGGGDGDAFVAKFTPSGTTLAYSSYLGGTLGDNGLGIGVDTAGNAYVFGFTGSPDFPTTPGAFQTGRSGLNDMFLTKVSR